MAWDGSVDELQLRHGNIEVPMSRRVQMSLGTGDSPVRFQTIDSGPTLTSSELALITLEHFKPDLDELYSRDRGSREGTLAISMNGQPTVLSWAEAARGAESQLKNSEKFQGSVVYFGPHASGIDTELRVIETDDDMKKRLGNVRDVLTKIAQHAGVVPGYGTAISAGSLVAAGVLDAIVELIEPELELAYLGALRGSEGANSSSGTTNDHHLRTGKYKLVRQPQGELSPHIDIGFRVRPFPIAPPGFAVVEIAEIVTDLSSSVRGCDLFFETTFGGGPKQQTFSLKEALRQGRRIAGEAYPLERVLELAGKRVYAGPVAKGLPFTINAAAIDDESELKALSGLVTSTSKALQPLVPEIETHAATITKAIQSARSTLIEFLPSKIGIGSINGMLLFGPELADTSTPSNFPMLHLPETADAGWGRVSEPIVLSSEKGGRMEIRLRARRIAAANSSSA